jgi:hypothetical protein
MAEQNADDPGFIGNADRDIGHVVEDAHHHGRDLRDLLLARSALQEVKASIMVPRPTIWTPFGRGQAREPLLPSERITRTPRRRPTCFDARRARAVPFSIAAPLPREAIFLCRRRS